MKMFINKTNIKLLAAALLTALAAPSCMNLDETREGGYGYLTISGLDLDVQVEQLVPTKAEPVTLKSLGVDAAPVLSEILFTLERHNSNPGTKSSEEDIVQPNEELPLEAGTYTLRVKYNGNNGADGFGEALFKEEEMSYPVTITPGERTQLEISLPLINSLIAVSVTDELKKDFTPSENYPITINYGNQTVTVEENVYHFVPATSEVTVTVTGTTAGVSKTLKHKFTTPSAAKFADVKFGKSTTEIPSITMGDNISEGAFEDGLYFSPAKLTNISSDHTVVYKYQLEGDSDWTTATEISDVNGYKYLSGLIDGKTYSIKACVGNIESDPVEFLPKSLESCITVAAATGYPQHYTENNELAGTNMQASVKVELPSIVALLATISVESGNFKKDNATIGTFKLDDKTLTNTTAKTIDVSNSADWPYFPKGDGYVLDATIKCVLPNRTIESGPVSSTATITSPAPDKLFTVTASANTTYSYYKDSNKGATEANKKTAENVFDITSSVTISDDILSKDTYKDMLPSVTYSVGGKSETRTYGQSKTHFMGTTEISGLAWGTHSLTAKVTFDGAEVTSAGYPCVITGLPYSYNFVNGSLDKYRADGWTTNGDLRVSNMSLLGRPTTLVLQQQDSEGFIVSPRFNITSDISVQASILRSSYFLYWGGSRSRTGYVGAVSNTSTSNTESRTFSCEGGSSTGGTVYGSDEWLAAFVISMLSPYISIDSDSRVNPSTASYYFLHAAHFRYAE